MRLLLKDEKALLARVLIENEEDLWWIAQCTAKGDLARAWTTRVIKKGTKEEKKRVLIAVKVEKVSFSGERNAVRFTGPIAESSDEENVQLGRYHSLDITPGTSVEIVKQSPAEFRLLLKTVERAKRFSSSKLLVVLVDDEHAKGYEVGTFSVEELWDIRKVREGEKEERREEFFSEILKALNRDFVILGGPGFEKEALAGFLRDRGIDVRVVGGYEVERSTVLYLLRSGALTKAGSSLAQEKELALWNDFLAHLGREDGLAAYGWAEVKKALEYGAAEHVFVLMSLIKEHKEWLEALEQFGQSTRVHLIADHSPIAEQLKSFGGVCAVLRYKID